MPASAMTLTDTLAALGYSHRRSAHGMYCHDIIRDGLVVFVGTAGETWNWLRSTSQLPDNNPTVT